MNSLLDEDTEDDLDDRPVRARDREITLGTTMVLGIFFALAAYGAVLFGFGYSMGVKHLTATPAVSETASSATFNGFKPPSGAPLAANGAAPASKPVASVAAPGPAQRESVTVLDGPAPAPVAAQPTPKPVSVPRPQATAPAAATIVPPPAVPPRNAPAASTPVIPPGSAGAFVVQVAAVSHQEDADMLAVTLKRHGYPVMVRHEPQDQLLHVQIGNFVTKKDADAMRLQLLSQGFNGIVK